MDVTLRRTGGFAGLRLARTLEVSQLTTEQREYLSLLSEQDPIPLSSQAAGRPDGFIYELELSSDQGTRMYMWPEQQLPASARPLFSMLKSRR